ncbi:hypothetical protein EDI_096550 [Entamoeba dispar SAW760]|uniref:Uncharacterized protein n=1 Tax=Entamoeba dispar (strain ATCC PRA-260 / SAW760) TaxID=370354 RepID=B0EBB1_ENTDS|nr:uncharacterized protein EDI_096550 [Entamoeba dispar SAW760]EDR28162.1 hypothetical protein EDI_096550 [Entamoeba dispar SAW760]|eukprot:EDR28162.1 hypothetical protein EDI_096550 [Entamoeba dispar SAW760]
MGNEIVKTLGKDTVKKLKQMGVLTNKGEFEKQVDQIPLIKRLWDPETGNKELVLPKGTLYELFCSYCLPFLFYKQIILVNRDLLMKHTDMVTTKLETIQLSMPKSVDTMRKLQIEMPKQLQLTMNSVETLKKRVEIIKENINKLEQFNEKLLKIINPPSTTSSLSLM